MSRQSKTWLAIAGMLVLIGCVIFAGVMSVLGWNFTKLSTVQYETNDYKITENFHSISIISDTADISIVPSDGSDCTVVCHEPINVTHTVKVKDGTLTVEINDTRAWYEYIGINFDTTTVTVSVPQGEYGALSIRSSTGKAEIAKEFRFESIDISQSTGSVVCRASVAGTAKIRTTTGDIRLESLSAGALDLSVSTGAVTISDVRCDGSIHVGVSTGRASLTDVVCQSLTSNGSTGGISMKGVLVSNRCAIERSTGDVSFDRCDAGEIFVRTSTGSVRGTLLSEKQFDASSSTGSIEVPKSTTGGRCEINTGTGNIKIEIQD